MKILFCLMHLFYRTVFFLFLCVWMSCSLAGAATYQLVNSADELIAGERYLVAGTDGNKWYALSYQKTDNRHAVEVMFADGIITTSAASSSKDQVFPYSLLLEGETGAWMWKDEMNSCYLRPDKSGNKLIGNTSSVKWKIEMQSSLTGEISMECVESNYISKTSSKYIRFNSNLLFSCYSDLLTQKSVYLFKEVKGEVTIVPSPVFSLGEGSYIGKQTLSISSAEGTVVYYTTDGTEPSESSLLYENPLAITASTIVKAVAYDTSGNASIVVSAHYVLVENTNDAQIYKCSFAETFDMNAGEGGVDDLWGGMLWSGYEEVCTDHSGWVFKPKGLAAYRCVLIGVRGESGQKASATTPELGISGKALLKFKAGAWNTANEKNQLTLRILNGGSFKDGTSSCVLTLKKGGFSEYEIPLSDLMAQSKVSFVSAETTSSSDSRFFLDEVEVFQPIAKEEVFGNIAALGGKWKVNELTDLLGILSSDSDSPCLELDVMPIPTLLSDLVIDNINGSSNLLVYSRTPLTVLNALNVVDGVFQSETRITDLQPLHVDQDISGPVRLNRSFVGVDAGTGGWQSICLPFTVTTVQGNGAEYIPYCEWIKTMPRDKGFYWLKTADYMAEKNDINTDASQIEANKPYIIAFPNYGYSDYPLLNLAVSTEFCFVGNKLLNTENLETVSMQNWWFQPSYYTYTDENCYVLNTTGDRFERASVGTTMTADPFRPYLRYKNGNGASFSPAFIIGNINAPESIDMLPDINRKYSVWEEEGKLVVDSPDVEEMPVYDFHGELVIRVRLVNGKNIVSLPAGIYIVAGQKIIIK